MGLVSWVAHLLMAYDTIRGVQQSTMIGDRCGEHTTYGTPMSQCVIVLVSI